jgi:hypothetical protein
MDDENSNSLLLDLEINRKLFLLRTHFFSENLNEWVDNTVSSEVKKFGKPGGVGGVKELNG